jgi:CheY-like chemotaxis protein
MATPEQTILVIDDSAPIRESLREILTDRGYLVRAAGDGRSALKQLRALPVKPDLILLDLMMPGMDGWEFREEQLRDPQLASIPVIIMTADPKLWSGSAAGVIVKPFSVDALLEAIRRLTDRNPLVHPARVFVRWGSLAPSLG